MPENSKTPQDRLRWPQFSLRALLLLISVAAVALAVWRALGARIAVSVLVAALLAFPVAMLRGALRRAYSISCLALYGPFLVMAGYTYFFVPCSHCKSTAWLLLPYGPALIPVDLAWRWLDLPRPSDAIWFALAACVSAAAIVALAWLIRSRHWLWGSAAVVLALLYCSFAAVVTLALIRA